MNRFTRLFSLTLVPAAVFALGAARSAHAQDVFNACSRNKDAKVRSSSVLANATPICKSTETPRSWNQTGPQGIPGFSSCTVEEFDGTAPANTFAVLNATCSSGKAVGSGAIWHTPFDAADNGPFYFFPRSAVMWTLIPWNHTGTASDFRMFLQCCQ